MEVQGGRVRRRQDDLAVVDEGGDRVAMLDLRRLEQPPIVLEGVAAVIWRLLDGSRTTEDVVAEVAGLTATSSDEIAQHVEAFVADLVGRDLAEVGDRA